ncbi:nucleobase-ascorbate transporter 11 [Daucus carota subsp. sativus]|nr:PREDICTED: nucleobase-ascorbate transporter 11 [Daucus carota subsp. sativus]
MEKGSSSEISEKVHTKKGLKKLSSMLPKVEPFLPRRDHNPRELISWAKRTGFRSTFSGETGTSLSEKGHSQSERNESEGFDLEKGLDKNGSSSPKFEIDPILGRTRDRGSEIEQVREGLRKNEREGNERLNGVVRGDNLRSRNEVESIFSDIDEVRVAGLSRNRNGGRGDDSRRDVASNVPLSEFKKDDEDVERDAGVDVHQSGEESGDEGWQKSFSLKCGMRDNPGFVPLICYGLQHYISLAGSLIFIPLIIVPTMGGTDKDTSYVISTMLFVSGVTTILQSYFGTRLPLVQGSSFVYLAPALVIMNSQEFRNLTEHKFRYTMRELQGAIIVGSTFQSILGFSGLMTLLLRFINPLVVAPTVAAVGLAFFSYGFPQAGSCVEISIPQILLVLLFTLYLRGVSVSGHRIFWIYAVPLSVVITWTYAFFLTAGGAYSYKGCVSNIPSSNILIDACRKHAQTMKHCRTDVSDAWHTAAWVRVPYPLQWGTPIFHLRTSIIMIIVSLIATVDSVGTYHSASVRISLRPPTPGIVSRGIGLEGFCSVLAGFWGTGTGSTTLTENVHTINITRVANRRAMELGAAFLILFSFIGKVGAVLASIPLSLAAATLCFIWALTVALGLSTLQYTQTSSFRSTTIVGVSLFLGFSIPAYIQQYRPESILILPSYFLPYSAASDGPFHTANKQLNFATNALLSMNMVVTFLVAFVLDNTVPGSQQKRGVYIWSNAEEATTDLSDYSLPNKVARCFHWAKCLGA